MRCVLAISALILGHTGCGGALAVPVARLQIDADAVEFEAVQIGSTSERELTLLNSGTTTTRVVIQAPPPFAAVDAVDLGPGASTSISLLFEPESYEDAVADVVLLWSGNRVVIPTSGTVNPDWDADGFEALEAGGQDCDDSDAATYPGADERCDGRDNDCDDQIDNNAIDADSWWQDADADGFGDPDVGRSACDQPVGFVAASDDCDDGNPEIYPGKTEQSDGVDQDCDGLIDEHLLRAGAVILSEIHDGEGSDLPSFVELVERNSPANLYLSGATFKVGTQALVLGPVVLQAGGEPVLLCGLTEPGVVDGMPCAGLLPTEELFGATLELEAEVSVNRVDTDGWLTTSGSSLELGPEGLRSGANEEEAAWCRSQRPVGPNFASPGEVADHCSSADL